MDNNEKMIKERLQGLIFNYNFKEAKEIFNELNEEKQDESLLLIANETESILIYTFICYLIAENNTALIHHLASVIMSTALCYIEGAYQTAFYHAKKAIELSPTDVELKEFLLFFYEIPEKLLTKEEAIKIATEILVTKKTSKVAKEIIKKV